MVLTIVLVVWVAVIPACVLALLEVVARKRCADRRRRASAGAGQLGQLLRFAPPHTGRREHVPSAGYGAVMRSSSSASGRRPGSGPRLRLDRTR
jgi:hypothetical protein